MIEFLILSLFIIGILLWLSSQPSPTKLYDIRFKKMLENDIERMKHRKSVSEAKKK